MSWWVYAFVSAGAAAFTAILAEIGIEVALMTAGAILTIG